MSWGYEAATLQPCNLIPPLIDNEALMQNEQFVREYTALRDGAAIQLRPEHGVLALSDVDRSAFLQRMTTNNIEALRVGQSAVTVLTSPTARIVFVFTVVCWADDLWLLPAAGEAQALERHLAGKIFFMDKVKVRNLGGELGRLRVMGAQAEAVLAAAGIDLLGAVNGSWSDHTPIMAVKQQEYDLPGVELVGPASALAGLQDRLVAAGAVVCQNDAAYTARRVELMRPLSGAELTGDSNPLEVGLAWACSESKGCYTGQEIIARQITYDKVTRMLVTLRSEQMLSPGQTLTVDGREVGVVTSAAFSPALNAPLALAIVKRPHNQPGALLSAADQTVTVTK